MDCSQTMGWGEAAANLPHSGKLYSRSSPTRVFLLKPADGAIGAHIQAVRKVYTDFEKLAEQIARRCALEQRAYGL